VKLAAMKTTAAGSGGQAPSCDAFLNCTPEKF